MCPPNDEGGGCEDHEYTLSAAYPGHVEELGTISKYHNIIRKNINSIIEIELTLESQSDSDIKYVGTVGLENEFEHPEIEHEMITLRQRSYRATIPPPTIFEGVEGATVIHTDSPHRPAIIIVISQRENTKANSAIRDTLRGGDRTVEYIIEDYVTQKYEWLENAVGFNIRQEYEIERNAHSDLSLNPDHVQIRYVTNTETVANVFSQFNGSDTVIYHATRRRAEQMLNYVWGRGQGRYRFENIEVERIHDMIKSELARIPENPHTDDEGRRIHTDIAERVAQTQGRVDDAKQKETQIAANINTAAPANQQQLQLYIQWQAARRHTQHILHKALAQAQERWGDIRQYMYDHRASLGAHTARLVATHYLDMVKLMTSYEPDSIMTSHEREDHYKRAHEAVDEVKTYNSRRTRR